MNANNLYQGGIVPQEAKCDLEELLNLKGKFSPKDCLSTSIPARAKAVHRCTALMLVVLKISRKKSTAEQPTTFPLYQADPRKDMYPPRLSLLLRGGGLWALAREGKKMTDRHSPIFCIAISCTRFIYRVESLSRLTTWFMNPLTLFRPYEI